MKLLIDTLFIGLCVVCFGTIIWYNVTEISKVRKLRQHHGRSDRCTKRR